MLRYREFVPTCNRTMNLQMQCSFITIRISKYEMDIAWAGFCFIKLIQGDKKEG